MEITNNMEYLMSPKTIAIIGCSEHNIGGVTLKNLQETGFKGAIYPVHPKGKPVFGIDCYTSIEDIPEVECAVIGLRNSLVIDTIKQLSEKNVKAAVILASGFAEVPGDEGKHIQQKLKKVIKDSNMAVCGPNCLGLINLNDRVSMFSAALDGELADGGVGVVSHSGSACIAMMSTGRGIGFSHMISTGNEVGVSSVDYFRFLVEDEKTKVIVGILEGINDPNGLSEVAKLAREKQKPIIILKVGKSEKGSLAAASHTGSIVGSSDLHQSFFKQNGIIEAESYNEVIEIAEVMLRYHNDLPKGNGMGLVAISGGQLALSCDIAESIGLNIPQINEETQQELAKYLPDFANTVNPLDVTSTGLFDLEAYKQCLLALSKDPAIDIIAVCQDATAGLNHSESVIYQNVAKAISEVANALPVPIVVFTHISGGLDTGIYNVLDAVDVPLLQGANESMVAIQKLINYAAYQPTTTSVEAVNQEVEVPDRESLSESESKKLLSSFGIRTTREITVRNVEEADAFADSVGYPLVAKIDSPDILHKTESGAIRLGIQNSEELKEAFFEVYENAKNYNPNAQLNGVNIQEMVQGGLEFIIGVRNDEVYGTYMVVGLGGVFVELFKDVSLRILPISKSDAYDMINDLQSKELLAGYRNGTTYDVEALTEAIVHLSAMAAQTKGQLSEIEINPLLVLEKGKGVVALDALITTNKKLVQSV
ncbi:acetate--CoA ligase family protein [Radiobacillus sp. PE A8.2]|uniref:acetate--CoA ligase family protein n=1 Tax=Radiobacillus sp. PE A8.2 TaxID=3380349 RepID=UPI00388E20F1